MLSERIILALLTVLLEQAGFGRQTARYLAYGLRNSRLKLSRSTKRIAREIRALYDACMQAVKMDQHAAVMQGMIATGGAVAWSASQTSSFIARLAMKRNVNSGKLFEACVFTVLYYKFSTRRFQFRTQVRSTGNRGGHTDLYITDPDGVLHVIEMKTITGTAYKVPLFEHFNGKHFLVTLGYNKYDLSDEKLRIMKAYKCQPVVVDPLLESRPGVITVDKMMEEMSPAPTSTPAPPKAAKA
jgi:hypothetical protein